MKDIISYALTGLCRRIFLLLDRRGERLYYLRPCHLTGVLNELLLGMRSKSTGIDSYAQHRDTIVSGSIARLLVKARGCDNNRRDTELLGNNTRTGLLGRTDAATAIARNNSINLQGNKTLTELLRRLALDARGGIRTGNGQFVVHNNLSRGIMFQNKPFELWMSNIIHKILTHDGNGLAVKSRQTRRHLNRLHR